MLLGDISIERIIEMETPFMLPGDMFPDAPMEAFEANRAWPEPAVLCPDTGKLIINIQTYIIRTPQHTILVDTCIGYVKEDKDAFKFQFAEWDN